MKDDKGKCFSMIDMGQRKSRDLYETPYSMTWQLLDFFNVEGYSFFDPACGNGAIIKAAQKYKIKFGGADISQGHDFLESIQKHPFIVTNPPYSLANEFIEKCYEVCKYTFWLLLPLSYLHGVTRYNQNTYRGLREVKIFVCMPLLGEPLREDGKYNTAMQVYGWYKFDGYLRERKDGKNKPFFFLDK